MLDVVRVVQEHQPQPADAPPSNKDRMRDLREVQERCTLCGNLVWMRDRLDHLVEKHQARTPFVPVPLPEPPTKQPRCTNTRCNAFVSSQWAKSGQGKGLCYRCFSKGNACG